MTEYYKYMYLKPMFSGTCKNCGFKVKHGEWQATRDLHYYCMTPKNKRLLREEAIKRHEEGLKQGTRGMGTHFGTSIRNGFCLEL